MNRIFVRLKRTSRGMQSGDVGVIDGYTVETFGGIEHPRAIVILGKDIRSIDIDDLEVISSK